MKYYFGLLVFLLFWAIFGLILLCTSCKTIQKVDKSQMDVNKHDSVRVEYVHDTITIDKVVTIEIHDTVKIEKNEESEYTFVEGGGTYNATTGEMSGITSIKTSKIEKELQATNKAQQERITEQKSHIQQLQDSISNLIDKSKMNKEHKEKANLWWLWLIIGALSMLIIIVVLKKLPYTRWLVFWI